ncbi:MAG: zinc-ribbon domain-containing protein [Chloroflexota bacterium]|nr:zinc-ribbon domain-containing protein [Chloroflexota bacterium]
MNKPESADQYLCCAACGDGFVFTAGEQEFYRLRGITTRPERCPTCVRGNTLSYGRRGAH